MADISKIVLPDNTEYEIKDAKARMVILRYGISTWNDFIAAYNNNCVVYCRASSNSNPATGSQTRLAFMAYVSNADTPTNVEFQYYRSMNKYTDAQQGDQVFVYKLTNANKWTVTTRNAFSKVIAGTNLTSSFVESETASSITLSADCDDTVTEDSTKLITSGAVYDALSTKADKIGLNTITGDYAVATFTTDCIAPMSKIVSNITPVQDLHGYSKPWSGGGGKNKYCDIFSEYTRPNDYRIFPIALTQGQTYKLSATLKGTAISGCVVALVKDGTQYSNFSGFTQVVNSSGYINTIPAFTVDETFTNPKLAIYCADETTFNSIFRNYNIQLEQGSTATAYEPYSNICPISGFSALNVARTGKNLFDKNSITGSSYIDTDGTIRTTSGWCVSDYIPVAVGNYTASQYAESGSGVYLAVFDTNKNIVRTVQMRTGLENTTLVTIGANEAYIRMSVRMTQIDTAQFENGNQASEYHAYNGQTASVNFGQTVYGGVADVTNGKVTITHVLKNIGANDISDNGTSGGLIELYVNGTSNKKNGQTNMLCNNLEVRANASAYAIRGRAGSSSVTFCLPTSDVPDFNSAKTWVTNNPIELVYELATPIEITTTPENLTALSGQTNNIFSDTGNLTEISYFEHVDNNLIKLIKACQL